MKRSRDDVFVSSQAKRPAISPRVEQPGQVQMSTASSAQRLTTDDALSYLKTVKEIFQDKRDKYEEFLDIMKNFKSQRLDTSGVILRVKELFKGNRDLILGFNTFLPKGYEITLPLEDEPFLRKKPVSFDEAYGFVTKLKTRFQGDDHLYKAFLAILNMYRKDSKSIREVYQEVSVIFQDHPDILVEFTRFLPEISSSVSLSYAQSVKNRVIPGDDRGSPMTIARSTHIEKKPAVYDRYIDDHESEQWNHVEKEKERGEDKEKNEWEQDDNLGHKRKSAHRDDSAAEQFYRGMQDMESAFREKVKDRLQDPETDAKFSDCTRSFISKFFTATQFQKLVTSLLGKHPDVVEACEDFVAYVEKNGKNFRAVKVDRDGDDHDRADREKTKDYDIRERDGHDRGAKDILGQKMPSYASKEKFMTKPIQELDLSNCESCTPSYRLLPDNYPIPSASWRTEIGNQVLNDHWVSVTSGSEDYSFKHMRKNQYEESLFRCEDDRFELDMLLESVKATAKRVEELIDIMNDNKTESSLLIEDHLTALNLRCIERLYGDHGLDVMDVLRRNAPLALSVILTRLKQKQDEWERCRADFNKVWAEIYAKNYHKSLDHRSFYFKQQDTKNLSAKALLAEIKEMSEKNQNEDEIVLSIGAGHKHPIKPHMEFEYPDLDLQEDVYQLIIYSCEEVCTPEQFDKVMKVWMIFFEPLLGVTSHPPNAEDNGYVVEGVEADNHIEQNLKNVGEENNCHSDGAAYCKPSDMLENGGKDNVASKSNMSCYASPGTAEEKSMNDENASALATLKGTDQANSDCGTGLIPSQESQCLEFLQDGVITNLPTSSTGTPPEEVKEEGELSPNGNLEENNFAASGDTDTKGAETACKSDPINGGIGGEQMCIEEAGEETDAHADDESAQGSSESEHASGNGDVSGSDSANEEGSPEDGAPDKKGESDGEADSVVNANGAEGTMPFPDRLLQTVKPLKMEVPEELHHKEENYRVFYGNDSFYLLLRLHQMLYERMQIAKLHSSSPENKWRILNDSDPTDLYARFKNALRNLLNGAFDNARFEDECRAIIGAQSYILFTLDKLIHKLVKQLQTIVTEEVDTKLLQLRTYESLRSPGTFADAVYHQNARFILPDDNLYRIESFPSAKRLTVQLMKNEHDKVDPMAVSMDPYFAAYLSDLLSVAPERMAKPGVFLKRNKKIFLTGDEMSDTAKAMEGVIIRNGVEVKVNCNSLKVSYVLDTEDFFYRTRKRRRVLYGSGSSGGGSNGCRRRARDCKLLYS